MNSANEGLFDLTEMWGTYWEHGQGCVLNQTG